MFRAMVQKMSKTTNQETWRWQHNRFYLKDINWPRLFPVHILICRKIQKLQPKKSSLPLCTSGVKHSRKENIWIIILYTYVFEVTWRITLLIKFHNNLSPEIIIYCHFWKHIKLWVRLHNRILYSKQTSAIFRKKEIPPHQNETLD